MCRMLSLISYWLFFRYVCWKLHQVHGIVYRKSFGSALGLYNTTSSSNTIQRVLTSPPPFPLKAPRRQVDNFCWADLRPINQSKRRRNHLNNSNTLSSPLGKACYIANPYQLHVLQRPCSDVNSPYKRNAELTGGPSLYQSLLFHSRATILSER